MISKPSRKFTFKVVSSYLALGILTIVMAFFIRSEIQEFISTRTVQDNGEKLLKASELLTALYEAESFSKLAMQTQIKQNFNIYTQKIDSIRHKINLLKQEKISDYQWRLLDSVQLLLQHKINNSQAFLKLKSRAKTSTIIDSILKVFRKMEIASGKLTITDFEKKPERLSPYERKVLEDWVTYLNDNVPISTDTKQVDSLIANSKSLLIAAKLSETKINNSVAIKELQLTNNDLELSKQLHRIVTDLEREIAIKTHNDTIKKQTALRSSIRLAGFTAIIGILIVGLFTFLLTRDFWKVQTYRQRLEKEKKYSEFLLSSREQLITTVSHDLRTPLQAITSYSELMEGISYTKQQFNYLKSIKQAAHYVNDLMNDLLDFSKLEAQQIQIDKKPFVPSKLLAEIYKNLAEIYANPGVDFISEIDNNLDIEILGDPLRIQQIVTNILTNAFKFTATGFVKLKAKASVISAHNITMVVVISDSGIGIKKERQKYIFQPFTQANSKIESKFGGYGLGLTISKKIVALLNGTLQLKSEENIGSSFTITIPLEFPAPLPLATQNEPSKTIHSPALLIIDDDSVLLDLLSALCSNLNLTCHSYHNFSSLDLTENLSYDLVLTDIQMPKINGFDVLKILKSPKCTHFNRQPIVAMTGRRDLTHTEYQKAGFTTTLPKPFTKAMFQELIKKLFPSYKAIVATPVNNPLLSSPTCLFSLEILQSFLGNDAEALRSILRTFVRDTKEYLKRMESAVNTNDIRAIKNIAHRMAPMHHQLQAYSTTYILDQLEIVDSLDIQKTELRKTFAQFKLNSIQLIRTIELFLATNSSYNS